MQSNAVSILALNDCFDSLPATHITKFPTQPRATLTGGPHPAPPAGLHTAIVIAHVIIFIIGMHWAPQLKGIDVQEDVGRLDGTRQMVGALAPAGTPTQQFSQGSVASPSGHRAVVAQACTPNASTTPQ